ncbi:MAG: Host specificity protein [Verrucomicrobiales bacterium]|nr:Host specificity protein [Verrucomicrobiales bacterium]
MKNRILIPVLFASFISLAARAQHAHLNAGAVSTVQGARLIFDNGADFNAAGGYVKTLTYTNASTYAGYYQQSITLTALAQTPPNAGPVPNAPALGSYIQAGIVSLEGPTDGAFAFWETGATAPTFILHAGEVGTNLFHLTEADGSPGTDPYGHIHGRRFTATKAGIYKVNFVLKDTSTNGVNGGPIHTPSDLLPIYFQAGVNFVSIEPDEDHTHLRVGTPAGDSWQIEVSEALGPNAIWQSVGDAVVGDDYIHMVIDEHEVLGQRFFRVKKVIP